MDAGASSVNGGDKKIFYKKNEFNNKLDDHLFTYEFYIIM